MEEKGLKSEDEDILGIFQSKEPKEQGNIIKLADYANHTSTDSFKRVVKENYTNPNKKRRNAIIGVMLGIVATFTGIGTYKQIQKYVENRQEPHSMSQSYDETTTTASSLDSENTIVTVEEVKQDFVDKYLEAYNQEYGTNYTSAKMFVNSLNAESVYETTSGKHITRGSSPDETKAILNELGEDFTVVEGYKDLVQIVMNGDRILASYNVQTGEFVYSGNDPALKEKLENSSFDEPTLEKLGIDLELLKQAAEVELADGVESKSSIGTRIESYNKSADGFEIGDE